MTDNLKLMSLALFAILLMACTQHAESPKTNLEPTQAPSADHVEPVLTINQKDPKLDNPIKRIAQLIKLDCENDRQCKTIGVGVSPCGGSPKHYVYSTQSSDVAKLTKLVQVYNEKQKLAQKGMVGTCRFISPPKTFCSQQTHTCVTKQDSLL